MTPDVRRVLGRDLLQQAYGAMRHDLRKTVLTMLGMAWGIATVVLLLAYGDGFGHAIQAIWDSYGSTAVGIFPGRTSQQAGGNKAGVQVHFTDDDVEMIRNCRAPGKARFPHARHDNHGPGGFPVFQLHDLWTNELSPTNQIR